MQLWPCGRPCDGITTSQVGVGLPITSSQVGAGPLFVLQVVSLFVRFYVSSQGCLPHLLPHDLTNNLSQVGGEQRGASDAALAVREAV